MSHNKDIWNTDVFSSSPIFKQLHSLTRHFKSFSKWPTLDDYQQLFKQYKLPITPVAQAQKIHSFEEQYEPRVYLKKQLQTRSENWHDFFNAMIWLSFSKTKTTLNHLHYHQARQRPMGSNRSALENRITQFDECGAIIISDNPELLELIRQHQWHKLFIEHRPQLEAHLACVVFGHAIFEKALKPYIGMTCHCILLENNKLLNEVKLGDLNKLDFEISEFWESHHNQIPPKLYPFPLLGLPNYWPDQKRHFYDNKSYFR